MKLLSTPDYAAPEGARIAAVKVDHRISLRAASWYPEGVARGTVVVLQGRGEFIERYFETIADLLQRGFAVIAFDWRGQGGSTRLLPDAQRGHIDDFSSYEADLDAILSELGSVMPKPLIGLGMSMGGMVALSALSSHPKLFSRCILISPMLGIGAARRGSGARLLAASLVRMGLAGSVAPGQKAKALLIKRFEHNPLSRDPVRFARNLSQLQIAPHLGCGPPTVGWVHAALQRIDWMATPAHLRRITTPILAIATPDDKVTLTAETERLCRLLPHATFVAIPDAGHELLMERDETRAAIWQAVDAFLGASKTLSRPAGEMSA